MQLGQVGQDFPIVVPALPKAAKAAKAKAPAVKKVVVTEGLSSYMPYILAGAGALVLIMLLRRSQNETGSTVSSNTF